MTSFHEIVYDTYLRVVISRTKFHVCAPSIFEEGKAHRHTNGIVLYSIDITIKSSSPCQVDLTAREVRLLNIKRIVSKTKV